MVRPRESGDKCLSVDRGGRDRSGKASVSLHLHS